MIVRREDIAKERIFTCPLDLAEGLLVCQKENLFSDPNRVMRLLGKEPWEFFSNFSEHEIAEACREAHLLNSEVAKIHLVGEAPKIKDEVEKRLAARIIEVLP